MVFFLLALSLRDVVVGSEEAGECWRQICGAPMGGLMSAFMLSVVFAYEEVNTIVAKFVAFTNAGLRFTTNMGSV